MGRIARRALIPSGQRIWRSQLSSRKKRRTRRREWNFLRMIWTDSVTNKETETGMMEEDIEEVTVVTVAEGNGEEGVDIVQGVTKIGLCLRFHLIQTTIPTKLLGSYPRRKSSKNGSSCSKSKQLDLYFSNSHNIKSSRVEVVTASICNNIESFYVSHHNAYHADPMYIAWSA
jgi:hypothetical protein